MANKKYKCGDVREDGMVFWRYNKASKGGEIWCTPDSFTRKTAAKKAGDKAYRQANKQAISSYRKEYGQINKSDLAIKKKKYYQANKAAHADRMKKYYQVNKETIAQQQKEKYTNEPLYRLSVLSRNRIVEAFKKQGYNKNSKTNMMLGCTFKYLKKHIEKQFTEGMSWHNQGEWHIDHRIPLAAVTDKKELIKLNHYTNLQPLWASNNLSKGDKYNPEELKAYLAA